MNSANPTTEGGSVFDLLVVNLSLTTSYSAAGPDASIAMRIVPARVGDDGLQVTLDASSIGVLRGRLAELRDDAEREFMASIIGALETLAAARGW